MEFTIRKAVWEDLPGILPLQEQIARLHAEGRPEMFKPNGRTMTPEEFAERLGDPKYTLLVAVRNGVVAGYAFAWVIAYRDHPTYKDFDCFYIDDICVSREHRRMGIGRALMTRCLEAAHERNCKNVELGVWSFNRGAIAFYESCGLREKTRRMERMLEE